MEVGGSHHRRPGPPRQPRVRPGSQAAAAQELISARHTALGETPMIPRISRMTLAFTLVVFTVPSLVHAGRGGFRGGGYRGGMGGGYRGGMGMRGPMMGRTGYGAGARMGYGGYHNGWYHGAWNGNYGGWG